MSALKLILESYREESHTEREKGNYFEMSRCPIRMSALRHSCVSRPFFKNDAYSL